MSDSLDLTEKEQKHVRTALMFLRFKHGGWYALAQALRFQGDTLEKAANGRSGISERMVFRVARFIGMSIDDLLEGKYVPVGTCPHCGRPPDFSDEDTAAG